MKPKFLTILFLIVVSCSKSEDVTPEPVYGCLDKESLNFNQLADTSDNSCKYSKITFYAKYNLFQNIPINKIDITINGEFIGSITNGFIWPNGPGNCSSTGTVQFEFTNPNSIDWNATLFLANGQTLSTGGSKSPNRFSECIKTNVTN